MKRLPVPKSTVSIDGVIHVIRGERVILDADLARLYGVETRVLNQAVRRNRDKFLPDFLLEINPREAEQLRRSRSQTVILKRGENVKFSPLAFTEHGALMAANILHNPQARAIAPANKRTNVKLAASIAAGRSARRQKSELAAKAAIASAVPGRTRLSGLDPEELMHALCPLARPLQVRADPSHAKPPSFRSDLCGFAAWRETCSFRVAPAGLTALRENPAS